MNELENFTYGVYDIEATAYIGKCVIENGGVCFPEGGRGSQQTDRVVGTGHHIIESMNNLVNTFHTHLKLDFVIMFSHEHFTAKYVSLLGWEVIFPQVRFSC